MLRQNCSLAVLSTTNATIFNDMGCPEAAVICGMNISWVLEKADNQDVAELCQSEEEYLSMHLGPQTSHVFLPVCIIYLTIFLVGILGNSLTCAVILHYKVMHTPTNYYLLSLAVSDLLVLLLGMPLELYEMRQNYPFLLGKGGCYFKTFLFETVCFASILNVTALSMERYIAVVHPLKVKSIVTRAHIKKVIFMLWMLSMLCAVPNTVVHGVEELPSKFGRNFPQSAICHVVWPKWIYNLIILISTLAFFLLPMLTISILYLRIGLQLHKNKIVSQMDNRGSYSPKDLTRSRKHRLSQRNLQVTKMLCVLVVLFGLCWAPFHVDRLMWSYMDTSSVHHLQLFEHIHIISGVCFYLSSVINPILYNLMSSRFREMFRHVTCHNSIWHKTTNSERTLHEKSLSSKGWT